jgi:hypothetical protein
MKWISMRKASKNEFYELWDNTKKILSLALNSDLNTARIEHKENKRMFMIERTGFLKNRTVLKNEYGVTVGAFGAEKWNSPEEFVDIDNERYYYTIEQNNNPELVIYKGGKKQPLISYCLGDPEAKSKIGPVPKGNKYAYVLMALCSYLFSPINSKERSLELA